MLSTVLCQRAQRRFGFASKIALPLRLGRRDRLRCVLMRFVARSGEGLETRRQRFFSLSCGFIDGSLGRLHACGGLQFDLLGASAEAHGGFFRLLDDFAEVFRSAGQLLFVFGALRKALLRKLRGQMSRELFELWSEASWQIFLQRGRGSFVGRTTSRLRFFVNTLDRGGKFLRQRFAGFGNLMLPLLRANASLGGNGLRRGFACSSLNLLPSVGQKAGNVTRELQRSIRCACGRRKHPNVVGAGRRGRFGFRKGNVKLCV